MPLVSMFNHIKMPPYYQTSEGSDYDLETTAHCCLTAGPTGRDSHLGV